MRALAAGSAYAGLGFIIGALLGTVRVLVLIPELGPLLAVVIELPVMLAVSWVVCGWLIRAIAVPARRADRAVMGLVAFLALMLCEIILSVLGFGVAPHAFFAGFLTGAGALGLAGQCLFALFPLVRISGR